MWISKFSDSSPWSTCLASFRRRNIGFSSKFFLAELAARGELFGSVTWLLGSQIVQRDVIWASSWGVQLSCAVMMDIKRDRQWLAHCSFRGMHGRDCICLSICLLAYLSTSLFVCLSVSLYVCLYLSVCLCSCLSVCLNDCWFVILSGLCLPDLFQRCSWNMQMCRWMPWQSWMNCNALCFVQRAVIVISPVSAWLPWQTWMDYTPASLTSLTNCLSLKLLHLSMFGKLDEGWLLPSVSFLWRCFVLFVEYKFNLLGVKCVLFGLATVVHFWDPSATWHTCATPP